MTTKDNLIEDLIVDVDYDIRSDGTIWAKKPLYGPPSPKKTYPWRRVDTSNDKGYRITRYQNKPLVAHRIVYRKFKGLLDPMMEINHIDGNKANNKPENLELVTRTKNIQHAVKTGLRSTGEDCPNAILTESDVQTIKKLLQQGKTPYSIAKQLGLPNKNLVSDIKYGKKWKHVK